MIKEMTIYYKKMREKKNKIKYKNKNGEKKARFGRNLKKKRKNNNFFLNNNQYICLKVLVSLPASNKKIYNSLLPTRSSACFKNKK